jgi:hypothetical protein
MGEEASTPVAAVAYRGPGLQPPYSEEDRHLEEKQSDLKYERNAHIDLM